MWLGLMENLWKEEHQSYHHRGYRIKINKVFWNRFGSFLEETGSVLEENSKRNLWRQIVLRVDRCSITGKDRTCFCQACLGIGTWIFSLILSELIAANFHNRDGFSFVAVNEYASRRRLWQSFFIFSYFTHLSFLLEFSTSLLNRIGITF